MNWNTLKLFFRIRFALPVLWGCLFAGPVQAEWPLNVITALAKDDPLYQGLLHFQKVLAERTDNQIPVRIFYGSQLGSDEDILEQARAGANVAVVIDGGRLSVYTHELGILGAPYLVNGLQQARSLVTSELFQSWEQELNEAANLQVLSFNWWQGERHLLTQKPVATPADLQGVRMRTIGAPVFLETIRAMGATPTPMPWAEIYPALQQDVIDGAEAQHQATYSSRLYEVIDRITMTGHINLMTGLVAGAGWFERLPDDLQQVVRQVALEAGDVASAITAQRQQEFERLMRAEGTEIVTIDTAPFEQATRSVYKLLDYEEIRVQVQRILAQAASEAEGAAP